MPLIKIKQRKLLEENRPGCGAGVVLFQKEWSGKTFCGGNVEAEV